MAVTAGIEPWRASFADDARHRRVVVVPGGWCEEVADLRDAICTDAARNRPDFSVVGVDPGFRRNPRIGPGGRIGGGNQRARRKNPYGHEKKTVPRFHGPSIAFASG